MDSAAYFNQNINFFFPEKSSRVPFSSFLTYFSMQGKIRILFFYFQREHPCRAPKFDLSIRKGSNSERSQSCNISYFDCVIAEFTSHTDVYIHELDY